MRNNKGIKELPIYFFVIFILSVLSISIYLLTYPEIISFFNKFIEINAYTKFSCQNKKIADSDLSNDIQRIYDNIYFMKHDTKLNTGMIVKTRGQNKKNDGYNGIYRIRTKTSRDFFKNGLYLDNYINIELDNGLIAQKIVRKKIPSVLNYHNDSYIIHKILAVCNTYTQNFIKFRYGNNYTAWDNAVYNIGGKWELDCSSFVNLLLHGVTFDNSRYNGNKENICNQEFFNDIDSNVYRVANRIAEWGVANGYAFFPNTDLSNIEAGDILFFSYPNIKSAFHENAFMHIDHVAMFLWKINNNQFQILHYYKNSTDFLATASSKTIKQCVLVVRFPFKFNKNYLAAY